MANPWHSRTTGRFISGPGGGGVVAVASGRSTLGGRVARFPSGNSARVYPGRTKLTVVGKLGPGGRVTAPGRVTGAYLRAHRYPLTNISMGSPIAGNRHTRYVSRTNVAASLTGGTLLGVRAGGRAVSYRGARSINAGRVPKSGYIVARAPRVRG